ncbi:MAG: hypothetical protein IKU52_00770 [Clostridia bacterium]|nr:hypothetical protein [Clostridia bacterium]
MENEKKFSIWKLISGFICFLGIGLCVLVFTMSIIDADGEISNIIWNEKAIEEYKNNPSGFSVEYYKVYEDHYFTEDGLFSVSKIRFMPTIGQWQMTVRYNKSSLERLEEDLDRSINRNDDVFTFALEDNEGNLYTDFEYKKTVKGRYTYYRIIFDDISIRATDELNIKIWFSQDIKDNIYPEEALGTLPLYSSQMPRDVYKFKKELPENNTGSKELLNSEELFD